MKKIYSLFIALVSCTAVSAQITITAADMPVNGDTLRYSYTTNGSIIDLPATGANVAWDYSALNPVGQRVDNYRTALQVNPLYAIISVNAYGYKVADSFPGLGAFLPISIRDIYTFYSKKPLVNPARFVAEGFAASISGIPTPAVYQDEDEMYFFPLDYGVTNDSSTFRLNFSLLTFGSMVQKGYRKTTVDGWGTIVTPYFTNPVNCIRVRSELHEVDSIAISPLPAIGIPRNTVEYKWLANGEHYPALWVTANLNGVNETITTVRYRDVYRAGLLNVPQAQRTISIIKAYPNPVNNDEVNFAIPDRWNNYTIDVYDVSGKKMAAHSNSSKIDIAMLAIGKYLVVASSGNESGYTWFEKQ